MISYGLCEVERVSNELFPDNLVFSLSNALKMFSVIPTCFSTCSLFSFYYFDVDLINPRQIRYGQTILLKILRHTNSHTLVLGSLIPLTVLILVSSTVHSTPMSFQWSYSNRRNHKENVKSKEHIVTDAIHHDSQFSSS